jgi:hypothetical protein
MKLTPQLASALASLRSSSDFQVFMNAIVDEVNTETDRALASEGTQCYRAQGAALKLREVYKTFIEAPAALEKFKQQR